jgi:hypothetical protein
MIKDMSSFGAWRYPLAVQELFGSNRVISSEAVNAGSWRLVMELHERPSLA